MSRPCSNRLHLILALAILAAGLSGLSGCSTLGNLGLPFTSSQHQLLKTTKSFSEQMVLPATWSSELSRQVLESYVVEPGDTLLIEAANFDSPARFFGDQTVMLDGKISLGKYGQHMVAGKTIDQIEAEVQSIVDSYEETKWLNDRAAAEARLAAEKSSEDDGDPETDSDTTDVETLLDLELPRPDVGPITARLVSLESKAFYVLGEVNSPGRFVLTGRETVLDAIVEAGGMSDQANQHHVVLSRPSGPCSPRMVVPICYKQISQLGDTSTNYQLRPGDRIFVGGKTFWDDIKATICFNRSECCPKCGPATRRAWIPMLDCNDVECSSELPPFVSPGNSFFETVEAVPADEDIDLAEK